MTTPLNDKQRQIELLKIKEEIARRNCYKSLSLFLRAMWKVLEPTNAYVHGWHIDAIAEHLHAITNFEIKNLIINVPPRHTKSLEVSVMWPSWVWLKQASRRFIFASYAQTLSDRDAVKMRTLISSFEYQTMFKPEWTFTDDQNQKRKFDNTETGFRFSTSVGGMLTGEGGDYLVGDDLQNAFDIPSQVYRESVYNWWKNSMSTRANNPKQVGKLIIMQRLHDDDLVGRLLRDAANGEGEKYETLILPAEYETNRKIISHTSLNFKDPRTKDKELLWPERFDKKAIADLKDALIDSESQLQQDPKPAAGGLFKEEWWGRYDAVPSDVIEIVQFWDCAQKPGITNDYSVCATWGRTQKSYVLLDLYREKTTAPVLEEMAKALYAQWKPDAVVIEDKSAGSSLIQYLLLKTHIPVLPFNPGQNDKEVRATAATPTVKAGKCLLPNKAILAQDGKTNNVAEFTNEHVKFPKAAHDDTVDTTSMMVEYFTKRTAIGGPRVR